MIPGATGLATNTYLSRHLFLYHVAQLQLKPKHTCILCWVETIPKGLGYLWPT